MVFGARARSQGEEIRQSLGGHFGHQTDGDHTYSERYHCRRLDRGGVGPGAVAVKALC